MPCCASHLLFKCVLIFLTGNIFQLLSQMIFKKLLLTSKPCETLMIIFLSLCLLFLLMKNECMFYREIWWDRWDIKPFLVLYSGTTPNLRKFHHRFKFINTPPPTPFYQNPLIYPEWKKLFSTFGKTNKMNCAFCNKSVQKRHKKQKHSYK